MEKKNKGMSLKNTEHRTQNTEYRIQNTDKKAVVLLSGGIDSTTTTAVAKSEGFEIYALSFNYGQRHRRELEAAKKVAEHLGVKAHLIIDIDLRAIGGSALTSEIEVPKRLRSQKSEVRSQEISCISTLNSQLSTIPVTYVPARNTIFLSFALAWAEVIGAEDIFMGANVIDYSGYPDCRPEYIEAFERMANLATKAGVERKMHFRIRTPLIRLTKAEIIKKGIELGVDYSLTWSCYDPQPATAGVQSSELGVTSEEKICELKTPNSGLQTRYVPCRRCDSCILRARGFKEAGINDPL